MTLLNRQFTKIVQQIPLTHQQPLSHSLFHYQTFQKKQNLKPSKYFVLRFCRRKEDETREECQEVEEFKVKEQQKLVLIQ